jgi:serine/threonine protein kinase
VASPRHHPLIDSGSTAAADAAGTQSRPDLPKLLPLMRSIARGLLHLHSRQPAILHRDIKPANVFVGHGMVMKIGDFGMSRHVFPTPADTAAAGNRCSAAAAAAGASAARPGSSNGGTGAAGGLRGSIGGARQMPAPGNRVQHAAATAAVVPAPAPAGLSSTPVPASQQQQQQYTNSSSCADAASALPVPSAILQGLQSVGAGTLQSRLGLSSLTAAAAAAAAAPVRTLTPGVVGTIAYSAPEVLDEQLQQPHATVERILKVSSWQVPKQL